MTYLTGHSQEIKGLLAALGIECKGVTGLRLIVEPDRMRAVLRLLADEIETWAPPASEAKICNLAVCEVAQRLRAEADK